MTNGERMVIAAQEERIAQLEDLMEQAAAEQALRLAQLDQRVCSLQAFLSQAQVQVAALFHDGNGGR